MKSVQLMCLVCGLFATLALGACTQHRIDVQPIRVEPIYMTIDVNVKVDRELDEFFDYKQPPEPLTPPANDIDSTEPPAIETIPPAPSGVNP